MHHFTGKWITCAEFADAEPVSPYHDVYDASAPHGYGRLAGSHILFRREFYWDGKGKVFLYYSADDFAKVFLNGAFVSEGPSPCYPFRYYYVKKEVTRFLHTGKNLLAFHTLYQGLINRVWVSGDLCHGLIFDLVCDGRLLACSDETVKVRRHGGYRASHIAGYDTQIIEDYDSRSGEEGFESPAYCDAAWGFALLQPHIKHTLVPQPCKALVYERMRPKLLRAENGVYVYDFEQEFVGVLLLTVQGAAGECAEVRCGEELNEDGSVRFQMRCNCEYRERWTLSGGRDRFEPFEYKAFRYVELHLPPHAALLSVQGRAQHYPFRLRVACGEKDTALQKVYTLCADTLKYGLQQVYLDCPTREKAQYWGDAVLSAMTHIALTGDASLYKKMMGELFCSAAVVPGGTALGPSSLVQKIAEYPLMAVASLRWYAKLSGDGRFLQACRKGAESILSTYAEQYAREDGLICVYDRWNVVDWPASARDGYDFDLPQGKEVHGYHNVINAWWVLALQAYDALYGEQPRNADRASAERAYRRAFYCGGEHRFSDSETSCHTALASQVFGLLTGTVRDGAAEELAERMIREKRLACSNLFVTPMLFLWLKKTGRIGLLHDLIKDGRAWLNMIGEGATVTFEAFSKNAKQNASLFHTMFAFPALFLRR